VGSEFSCQNSHRWDTVTANATVPAGSSTDAVATGIRSRRRSSSPEFGQFKKRLAWRSEWESLDQARKEITNYVDAYHRRPHSGLAYRTPAEVAAAWRPDPDVLQTPAT
jgi:hypothetical protein